MSTPDAEDASSSPPDRDVGLDEKVDMAEQKLPRPGDAKSQSQQASGAQKSSNAKDPHRVRRKKARRACYACQRAHLTCSDERPCGRCIKRGLGDGCQDGLRKKAKYLDDTPSEALLPGVGNYHHPNGNQPIQLATSVPFPSPASTLPPQGPLYSPTPGGTFNMYGPPAGQAQLQMPVQDNAMLGPYSTQTTPLSPTFQAQQTSSQRSPPVLSAAMTSPMSSASQSAGAQMQNFAGLAYNPGDPAFFNFDVSSLNFGNHYGALEFGMLGHMSSGAAETPPSEGGALGPAGGMGGIYPGRPSSTHVSGGVPYGSDGTQDWQSRPGSVQQTPHNTPITAKMEHGDNPHAFAIGAASSSISSASPGSSQHEVMTTYDSTPVSPAFLAPNQGLPQQQLFYGRPQQQLPQQAQQPQSAPLPLQPLNLNAMSRKRRRDTKQIYEGIKQPYSYTEAFHRFQRLVKERFDSTQVFRIAKAMALIRPSFIKISSDLNEDDLLYAERSFQRKLWVYEDELEYTGTPTLICRRTGEVAAVSKEYSQLTGWPRNVILGRDPNFHSYPTSRGSESSSRRSESTVRGAGGPGSAKSDGGANDSSSVPPPLSSSSSSNKGPQPMFIAELLDHESVVQFYEDFAQLAFGDTRGHMNRRVNLVRYNPRPAVSPGREGDPNPTKGGLKRMSSQQQQQYVKIEDRLDSALEGGPGGMGGGGPVMHQMPPGVQESGMIDCMMTCSVWRDTFDMPTILSINFLPIYQQR